jgi:hypothetical protein
MDSSMISQPDFVDPPRTDLAHGQYRPDAPNRAAALARNLEQTRERNAARKAGTYQPPPRARKPRAPKTPRQLSQWELNHPHDDVAPQNPPTATPRPAGGRHRRREYLRPAGVPGRWRPMVGLAIVAAVAGFALAANLHDIPPVDVAKGTTCMAIGDRICEPGNKANMAPGCYNDAERLAASWPCQPWKPSDSGWMPADTNIAPAPLADSDQPPTAPGTDVPPSDDGPLPPAGPPAGRMPRHDGHDLLWFHDGHYWLWHHHRHVWVQLRPRI